MSSRPYYDDDDRNDRDDDIPSSTRSRRARLTQAGVPPPSSNFDPSTGHTQPNGNAQSAAINGPRHNGLVVNGLGGSRHWGTSIADDAPPSYFSGSAETPPPSYHSYEPGRQSVSELLPDAHVRAVNNVYPAALSTNTAFDPSYRGLDSDWLAPSRIIRLPERRAPQDRPPRQSIFPEGFDPSRSPAYYLDLVIEANPELREIMAARSARQTTPTNRDGNSRWSPSRRAQAAAGLSLPSASAEPTAAPSLPPAYPREDSSSSSASRNRSAGSSLQFALSVDGRHYGGPMPSPRRSSRRAPRDTERRS